MFEPRIEFKLYESPFKKKRDDDGDHNPLADEDNDELYTGPALVGPMGIIAMSEPNSSFNFWMLHTNFKITDDVMALIDFDIEGVETLEQITPYRLRISIGSLFSQKDVQNELRNKIIKFVRSKMKIPKGMDPYKINVLKNALKKQHKFWSISFNGVTVNYRFGKTKEEVVKKTELLKPDSVIYSWEEE